MSQCRKCGEKRITRRRAGEFFCQRCGMQPGNSQMDRVGNPIPFLVLDVEVSDEASAHE